MNNFKERNFCCTEEKIERGNKISMDISTNIINCPTLLSGMSHEMRTHMNSIVAFSFLMNSDNYSEEEKKEFSNQILNSCEQLISLFDNFFDSAIIDTGILKAELRPCNLDTLIEELMSEIREIMKRHDTKNLVLILENHVHVKEEILLDTIRVIRVLRNLFQNAVCNTKSGYIKVGYRLNEEELVFYVKDTGNGFEKSADFLSTDDLQAALQKYNDTAAAINLTVAKKMVKLMGGNIWIETNGNSGSALFFNVPVKIAEASQIKINQYTNARIAI